MQENYRELKEAANRISGNSHLASELLHYCVDQFLRRKDCEAIVLSGGGRFYIVRIMMNQWASTTSDFFHTYRRNDEQIKGEIEDQIYEEDPRIYSPEDCCFGSIVCHYPIKRLS